MIVTNHVYPPIPDRQFDWVAYHDGEEELPWFHGWGPTEEEAIADLRRLDGEREDEDEEPPAPCTIAAVTSGCICRMETMNSASINPPEPVINRACPLHGAVPYDEVPF